MKKIFLFIAGSILLALGCNKSTDQQLDPAGDAPVAVTTRHCATEEVFQEQLKADPSLAQRMASIEEFTRNFANNPDAGRLVNGVMEIPVVVNVLWRTASENVSDAQINSQIIALNQDYSATNADYNSVPTVFSNLRSGNCGIRFVLDAVVRKQTNKKSWSTNDAMKKSSQGGINPTSPTTKLNMWVCTLSNGILGYAQFPGGPAATDGVVILNTGFGTTGTAQAPFNKGRTATHEIGHWFNLRHIWGDASCGNDLVDDTPIHNSANYGCPGTPTSTCGGTAHPMMTMNYMDYTDDPCMYMFTIGQKTRMQATYATGGPRQSFR
ncbi:MAG: zinc metalloprotease [Chitinophagaceae bacterium]|nr:zinc metalloprotease [Chitinophagaceae bacterium]